MRLMRFLTMLLVMAATGSPVFAQSDDSFPVAVLGGLDKVAARVSSFEAPVDQPVRFGTLEIVVRHCQMRPPEEPPETAAFLEITEARPDQTPKTVFSGWMFASSPALSALEHPVYDVWLIRCKTASGEADGSSK